MPSVSHGLVPPQPGNFAYVDKSAGSSAPASLLGRLIRGSSPFPRAMIQQNLFAAGQTVSPTLCSGGHP
ncbi:hypothetical protein CVCC1112_2132 [Paenarthrobacter nicotinovorans]|nr:hypothetical protein CVCC1112_2132 [Paenarthrobacter nicotinovorans]